MIDVTTDTLKDLKNLDEKIQKIYFLDREKYEYFKAKIEELKIELTKVTDNISLKNVLDSIVQLEYEYNEYLTRPNNGKLTLRNESDNITALKKHRIDLFAETAEVSYKGKVDPEKIHKLREIWKKEQEKLEYNSAEIDIVEEAFANMFLAYQIYYLNENNSMPKEKIEDFCNVEHYMHELQDRVKEKLPKGDETDKLLEKEIEFAFLDGGLNEFLENESIWSLLTGRKIDKASLQVSYNLSLEKEKQEEEKNLNVIDSNYSIVSAERNLGNAAVILTLEKNNIFGNRIKKFKKIKVNNEGEFKIPYRIRKYVVEAIVPENAILKECWLFNEKLRTSKYGAFEDCVNLKNISLPSSLKELGWRTFKNCTSLESIEIPDGIRKIGDGTFINCRSLKNVKLPNKLEVIESVTFYNCSDLTHIELPNKLEVIESEAFYSCSDLAHIELPNRLRAIDSKAFSNSGLEEVIIPKSVTDMGDYVFESCHYLKKAKILANISSIPYRTFSNCDQLETLILPESVKGISEQALANCKALKEILTPLKNISDLKISRKGNNSERLVKCIYRIEKTKGKSEKPKDSTLDESMKQYREVLRFMEENDDGDEQSL